MLVLSYVENAQSDGKIDTARRMQMIQSIIVVRQYDGKGYTAHLRFEDKSKDRDISANNKWGIHRMIDRIVNA